MERPSRSSSAVKLRAAESLAPEIHEWFGKHGPTVAEIVSDLTKIHWPNDGYEFARELADRCRYDPDARLVEILDSASSYLRSAHDDAVREWVKTDGVTLAMQAGDICQFTFQRTDTPRNGVISEVRPELAEYLVVPDSEKERFAKGGGYVLTCERVSAFIQQEPPCT